jgi:hypothetical protein
VLQLGGGVDMEQLLEGALVLWRQSWRTAREQVGREPGGEEMVVGRGLDGNMLRVSQGQGRQS